MPRAPLRVDGRALRLLRISRLPARSGEGESHGWRVWANVEMAGAICHGGKRGIAVQLTGIDLNPYAVRAAREFTDPGSSIEWLTGDAFSYNPAAPVSIVISSLFTHHLAGAEIVQFLMWMERVAERGWFVNDLHRKRVPYYGFKALAWMMGWHRFVRHDGPISIRRSFLREDWQRFCDSAGVRREDVRIEEIRPARLCVARTKP